MSSIRLLAAIGAAAFTVGAFAQQVPVASSTASRPSPSLQYRSAFEGYRPYREPEARSWRESNEEAGSLRGHAGHLKPPASPVSSEKSAVQPAGPATAPSEKAQPLSSAVSPATPTPPPPVKPAGPGHKEHAK